MKTKNKIALLFFISIFSVSLAQNKPAKKAQKITDEMTEVLDLNKKESKAVYKIQFERFKEGQAIRKEYADQPELRKEKLNKLGSKVYNQLKNYLGMDRLKQWKAHNKAKKNN